VAWTTRSCQELAFVDEMLSLGFPAYCPMTARYNANRKLIHEPAFKGYAFVAIPGEVGTEGYADAMYAVRGSRRLASRTIIPIRQQERFIDEMNRVRSALDTDPAIMATRHCVPGRRVRVCGGTWRGHEGVIDHAKAGVVVILVREVLGGVELPVTMDQMEFLDD